MKIAVKSAVAGAAIVAAATFGASMAQADSENGDARHSGSYGPQSAERQYAKHEPGTKTSRLWGPSQSSGQWNATDSSGQMGMSQTSGDWGPSQFGSATAS